MKTKKLFLSAFIFCTLALNQNLFASHIVGSMITYEYVSPNQYLLTFKYYRDCFGIPAPSTVGICYSSASLSLNGTVTVTPIPGTGMEIFPSNCFVNTLSSCQGGFGPGIQEWVYQGMVTLPQQASDWIFEFEQCCRSTWITTLNNGAGVGEYVYAKLDNFNFSANSSPQYSLPFAQYCLNILSTYILSCTEPDGDSLVYFMAPAQDATLACPMTAIPVIYNPPYSATYPVSSSSPVSFDPATGTFSFVPDLQQIGVIDILIKEYRNGNVVGEVKNDNMIFIINGIPDPDYIKGKVFSDLNDNGIYDNAEPGIFGTIVTAQPGIYLGTSNGFGDYSIATTPGTYTATIPNPPLYSTVTPASHIVTFTGTFQTDSINNFAVNFIPNIQDLRITLAGINMSPGSISYMNINYKNVGTAYIPNGTVTLIYDTNLVYMNGTILPDVISGDTLTWNLSNIMPSASSNIYIYFSLPASVPLNTLLTSYAEILPIAGDTIPQDNVYILTQTVVTPVDPNTKTVNPAGPITTSQVANGDFLEYTIYFQNTGTAPAINVYIDDTLDQNFNIPTFEVLSASHNYTWNITGPGIVKFTFNNIMLPDSGTNQVLSCGFIKYRIKPKNNLVVGDKMINTAYIVFDSNAPLMTNSTSTTVINAISVTELSSDVADPAVYPNPSNNVLNIEMNLKEATSLNVHLYNLIGEPLLQTEYFATTGLFKKQVNTADLSTGIYFLKIATSKGISVVKIVKNKFR